MKTYKVILAAAAVVLTTAAAMLTNKQEEAPDISTIDGDFIFRNGRLWTRVSDGKEEAFAIVDTGTSMSAFPQAWAKRFPARAPQRVSSPFGQLSMPSFHPAGIKAADREIGLDSALALRSSVPLIGADFIFASPVVEISKEGLHFGKSYDPDAAVYCSPLILDFAGVSTAAAVKSVYLNLPIDGREQKTFLDTGRKEVLAATALAPIDGEKTRTRIDVRFNSLGQWKITPYYSRKATIGLGNFRLNADYQHFYRDTSVDAAFVLGAGILERYSLVVDRSNGRICFFDR